VLAGQKIFRRLACAAREMQFHFPSPPSEDGDPPFKPLFLVSFVRSPDLYLPVFVYAPRSLPPRKVFDGSGVFSPSFYSIGCVMVPTSSLFHCSPPPLPLRARVSFCPLRGLPFFVSTSRDETFRMSQRLRDFSYCPPLFFYRLWGEIPVAGCARCFFLSTSDPELKLHPPFLRSISPSHLSALCFLPSSLVL